MNSLSTSDVYEIHTLFLLLSDEGIFKSNNRRRNYFLATCLFIEPTINLDLAAKLRPYGGFIGIDNSSLDKYLRISKVLRLHAVLHDACGFLHERTNKGPGYTYCLPIRYNNCFLGHLSGLAFCLRVKFFHQKLFNSLNL